MLFDPSEATPFFKLAIYQRVCGTAVRLTPWTVRLSV